jgi:hypothetical protein
MTGSLVYIHQKEMGGNYLKSVMFTWDINGSEICQGLELSISVIA